MELLNLLAFLELKGASFVLRRMLGGLLDGVWSLETQA